MLPSIPDDASEREKNGLAIRNACTTEGRCPCCGAVGEVHPDAELEHMWHVVFEHENWCAALTSDRGPA